MKTDELISATKHNDLIYDVGMHHGEDADFYLQKGFRCIAFEADPDNANYCRKKFAGAIQSGQLIIVEGAIIEADTIAAGQKTVKFYKNEDLSVLGTVSSEWAKQNEKLGAASKVVEVGIVNFESALKEHGVPHFMKVDIEGCDLVCLKALERFKQRPDYVSFEADRRRFANNREEIGLLVRLGYHDFKIVEQSEGPLSQVPPQPAKEGKSIAYQFEKDSSGLFGAELGGQWKSSHEMLRLVRSIRLGHYLVGNSGVMMGWSFKGSRRLQSWARRLVHSLTNTAVPGWHDIHARHVDVAK